MACFECKRGVKKSRILSAKKCFMRILKTLQKYTQKLYFLEKIGLFLKEK
jgi:hypothetical protein